MPFRQRGSYGRRMSRGPRPVINSIKNQPNGFDAGSAGANAFVLIAKAVNTPSSIVSTDVSQGCIVKAIWVELWITASATVAEGVTTGIDAYIWKNPGGNLTAPAPGSVGTSNEKKFVFKSWKGLIGSRKEGFPAYTWRGWVRVPKIYQRMGTDDLLQLVFKSTGVNTLVCNNFIYKWYR